MEKQIITIRVSKYLTNALAEKIALAQWHSDKPEWVNRIREFIACDSEDSDCFCVVAANQHDDVVGRLYCIQNETDPRLWYYGDLFVIPAYRRLGIAGNMIRTAASHLCERRAERLRCYVEPENSPSIALQKSLGFAEKPHEPFNMLNTEGQLMFELSLPSPYSAIPAAESEARFIARFYRQNMETLHGEAISLDEWKACLSADDADEENFLICRGCLPVAWLRINGLLNQDMAWIAMLVVGKNNQRQGVGEYAVRFAEQYAVQRGFHQLGIHTTGDNIPAQRLYRKCGYRVTERQEDLWPDGTRQIIWTFTKRNLTPS